MDKATSDFKVRKTIHQNQLCFIPNYTDILFLVPQVDFVQFKSIPALWIKQPVVLR